jgi:hypothetical protein
MSASQLGMYQRCGEQYRRRYVEGEIIPPNGRMIRGTGVHQARKANLSQKMETGADLPVEACEIAARDSVVGAFAGAVLLNPGEKASEAKAEAIDGAVRLAKCDREVFQVDIVPTAVESEITVAVSGLGRDIKGILDTADNKAIVRDLKTTSKTPSQSAADGSDQLTTYALLYRTKFGILPSKVQLDAVVDLAKGPKAVAVTSVRTADDLDMILRRYFAAIKGIDAGVFIPCPSDFWLCNPAWCGYYGTCPYVRRGESRPES